MMKTDLRYWIIVAGLVVLAYLISFIFRRILTVIIRKKSENIGEDPTKFVFLKNSVSFLIFTTAIIIIFLLTPGLDSIGKGIFAGAGILAATIGFASQKAFSNILSGIFILIFKPFRVRDTVEIISEKTKGVVEEITLRHTVIRDYENRRIIIPNAVISETTLINSSITDQRIRKHVEFGISYDSDIDIAKDIIGEEILNHTLYKDERTEEEKLAGEPDVPMRVVELGDFAVKIRAYVWASSNDDAFALQCDVLESVKKRFDREGIEIPFPYRTVVMKNSKKS
jgi:small-conductance mechanosensitive channel